MKHTIDRINIGSRFAADGRAGRAPLVLSKSGKYYPMELHHTIPRRNGGGHNYSNLERVTPWQHAKIDKYRHFKE